MSEAAPDFDPLVRKRFKVNDTFQLPDGEVEYKVGYGKDSKKDFRTLFSELRSIGWSPWLVGSEEDCSLVVRKRQPPPASASKIPAVMAVFAAASVVVFGLLEILIYAEFAPVIPWYAVLVSYCGCVLAILAAHEFGHRYVAERRGSAALAPYMIPGIPVVTAFLPSLGIISTQREPAVNRDDLFDVAIAGPLAALGVALVLYVLSSFAVVQSSMPLSQTQVVNSGLLQAAMDYVLSPLVRQPAPGYFMLSPVSDAAVIGFTLTFITLLPMSFFDGGYLASTTLGERGLRVATYLSVIALVVLDTPTYWALAIFSLLIASRQQRPLLLDEVSRPARTKRFILVLVIIVAFLCLPVPQNFATFPLG